MTFPQPPWTQAPAEVMAWRSSVGGHRAPPLGPHHATHVRGFEVELPAALEPRLLARLSRVGLSPRTEARAHVPHLITRLAHHAPAEVFAGKAGGARVEVRLRKRARVEVHVAFVPPLAFRKASRFVAQLGLRTSEGAWV